MPFGIIHFFIYISSVVLFSGLLSQCGLTMVAEFFYYLVGPYYTGLKLTPAPSTPPLLALFFKCSWLNFHRQTCAAGPFNAISQKNAI